MRASRRTSIISTLGLLASGLAAFAGVATLTGPAQAAADVERWCGAGVARPCIVEAKLNGSALNAGNSDIRLMNPTSEGGYRNIQLWVNGITFSGPTDPLTDVYSIVVDTGTGFVPQRIQGINSLDDVDVWTDSSGHHLARLTAHAVMWAEGCDSTKPWPWPCTSQADSSYPMLETDLADLDDDGDEFVGFYAGTNATFNGIFLEHASDGTPYLYTEAVAPHYQSDGTTLVHGDIRFRVPYSMLRGSWGIPNPETLVPGSFAGSINGSTTAGSFAISQDPDGNGIFVDVTGFTFSLKKVKVARGTIWPTRNSILSTSRVTAYKGKVVFTRSKPRGAKVTGYVARCVAGKHVVTVRGSYPSIVVTGLHRGVAYYCKVKATSKVGPSAWSVAKKLAARP